MKTGIIRRFDDLGRIVVPPEIRRKLHLTEGMPMEISISRKGSIVLTPYKPDKQALAILDATTRYFTSEADADDCPPDLQRKIAESLRGFSIEIKEAKLKRQNVLEELHSTEAEGTDGQEN